MSYPVLDTIIPTADRQRVIVKGRYPGETRRHARYGDVVCTVVRLDSGRDVMCAPADIAPDLAWVQRSAPLNVVGFPVGGRR